MHQQSKYKNSFNDQFDDLSTRFVSTDPNERNRQEIEWLESSLAATQFFMEYESGMSYSGQWDINQTVRYLTSSI